MRANKNKLVLGLKTWYIARTKIILRTTITYVLGLFLLRVIILIVSERGFEQRITNDVARMKDVKSAFSVFGKYDVVVLVETANHEKLRDLSKIVGSLPGVKRIETLIGFNPPTPSRIIDPASSYKFVMSVSPNLLRGVSVAKWMAFLEKLEARHIRIGETASRDILEEVGRELELSLEQTSRINCTKKCLELYDHNDVAFKACMKHCRRTGDP